MSNNCGTTLDQIQHKFRTLLNINNIHSKSIITSSVSTAIYLKSKMDIKTEKVFLIAQEPFRRTLEDHGIQSFGMGPVEIIKDVHDWEHFEVDSSVKYVIVTFDPYYNHTKLTEAYLYIKENNAEYISPDCDDFCFSVSPTRKVPGPLSIHSGLSTILDMKPKIMGKPDPFLFELIQTVHGKLDQKKTIMIGDNYETDVKFGFNCGISTALVLTGRAKPEDVGGFKIKPNFVLTTLSDISQNSDDL